MARHFPSATEAAAAIAGKADERVVVDDCPWMLMPTIKTTMEMMTRRLDQHRWHVDQGYRLGRRFGKSCKLYCVPFKLRVLTGSVEVALRPTRQVR